MDEKLEELAKIVKVLNDAFSGPYDYILPTHADRIARALLAAGYAKRSDTIEECKQTILADAGAWGDAAFSLAEQIANLKEKP